MNWFKGVKAVYGLILGPKMTANAVYLSTVDRSYTS